MKNKEKNISKPLIDMSKNELMKNKKLTEIENNKYRNSSHFSLIFIFSNIVIFN